MKMLLCASADKYVNFPDLAIGSNRQIFHRKELPRNITKYIDSDVIRAVSVMRIIL